MATEKYNLRHRWTQPTQKDEREMLLKNKENEMEQFFLSPFNH